MEHTKSDQYEIKNQVTHSLTLAPGGLGLSSEDFQNSEAILMRKVQDVGGELTVEGLPLRMAAADLVKRMEAQYEPAAGSAKAKVTDVDLDSPLETPEQRAKYLAAIRKVTETQK